MGPVLVFILVEWLVDGLAAAAAAGYLVPAIATFVSSLMWREIFRALGFAL
jgi:hypothetical protein